MTKKNLSRIKTIAAAVVAAVALTAPATASASYTITQNRAEANVVDAAEFRYEPWGVSADGAYCAPQGVHFSRGQRFYFRYHRWTCTWVGEDGEGRDVYGQFVIAGQSDGTYAYKPVRGGLHWG